MSTNGIDTNLFSIENKIIIVTGAGRGIGRYLAINMAKRSALVFCIDVSCSSCLWCCFTTSY